jgi:hypothetical protein
MATAAQFIGAAGIAADRHGNIYFSDINNRRIRKVNMAGIISTVGGNGSTGYSGDGGPATAAALNAPYGVATDASGNLYFADELNYRIRKIDAAGIISTVAGNGIAGFAGDGGPATAAQFTPTGVAVDGAGNIYVASVNRVRKINTAGIVTTVAGTGIAGYSGDGGAGTLAKLNQPVGVAVDDLGNVYISDQYSYRIRKVSPDGIISTIAGTGTAGFAGDGGPATDAMVRQPLGICTDPYANVYFCDWGNYRVRKISSGNHLPSFINWPVDSVAVCANSVGNTLNDLLAVADIDTAQNLHWTLVSPAMHGTATVAYATLSTGDTVLPAGCTYTPTLGYTGNDTFKVRVDDGLSLDTLTVYIRVKPLPDTGMILGLSDICMGTPSTLTDVQPGGVWSATNGHATITGAGVVNGITPGTDTILCTYTQEGCALAASRVVTVYPVTDTITGPAAVCTGTHITLNGTPAGGAWNMTNTLATVAGGVVTGDTAGVDTVIYTISNVCGIFSTTMPITVIGFTIPTVVISSTPLTILSGEPDTLVAHITHGGGISYGYQWQINTNTIVGATDSVFICDTFKNADSITCLISNGPCNFQTFSWTYIEYHTNGTNDLQVPATALRLLPNPAKETFTVDGILNTASTEARITITDMAGRTIWQGTTPIDHHRIRRQITPTVPLTSGSYLLEVTTPDSRQVLRLVATE